MRKNSKRDRALSAVCEALEERRLLVAFQLLVDDQLVGGPTTVNFGTVEQNKPGTTRKLAFRYIGSATCDVSGSLSNADNAFEITGGDDGFKTLSNGQSYVVFCRLVTEVPAMRDGDFDFSFHEGTNPSENRRHSLIGTVLPSSVGGAEDLGSMTNSTKLKSSIIKVQIRSDNEGNTLEQSEPYLGKFNLPSAQTKIDVTLKGISRAISGVPNAFTSGKIGFILTRDADNNGLLSVQERERSDAIRFTTNQIQPNGSTTSTANKTYAAGNYLVHIFTASMAIDSGNATRELGFDLTLKVDDIAPPAFEVRGKDVIIEKNDTTPAQADGTSFGSVQAGNELTLTFTVKNTGQTTMNIDGDRPDVNGGDFTIFEDGLNSTIAAGASDTFTVKLIDLTPGIKTGTIEIQSSNAQGGKFTFAIGGTVTDPPPVPPTFAVASGNTLTVTGTGSVDTLTSTATGSTFFFTLNGSQSASFSTTTITKIVINLLDGNDSYSSSTQLDVKQTINGGNGDDLIRAGKQADVMNGGDGNDRMDGRSRGDVFNGEGGSDTAIYRQRHEDVTVTIDELPHDGGGTDQFKDNVLSSTEHIQGGLGNDHLTGSSKTNRLFGFEGNDILVGLKGNDLLDGGSGINNLSGGFGNDQLFSRNTIADVIDGGTDANGLDIDTLTGDVNDTVTNVETKNLA